MLSLIAKIAVSAAVYAIDKPYSYVVPPGMTLLPGVRVMVPFGRGNRSTEGMVLSLEEGDEAELKCVDRALDPEPVLDDAMLRLAAFVRERYFCTFYAALRAALPVGLWYQVQDTFTLASGKPWEGKTVRQADAQRVLALLEDLGGAGSYSALRNAFTEEEPLQAALRYLLRKKWITTQSDFLRRAGDKTERIAVLSACAEEAMDYARRKAKSAPMQAALLELLCSLGSCTVKELCYYTGATAAVVRRLEKLGYLSLQDRPVLRCREIVPAKQEGPLTLNAAQAAAYDVLAGKLEEDGPGVALLYGVTGSGKTAVYLKLIARCLEMGKEALLLVPEIALTPQLLSLLAAHFGKHVAVLHSSLPPGERYDQWRQVRQGQAKVVVGTRSAVFAPCRNLGIIILDEEQERSYQSENTPRYCAREVAIFRGSREKALVLLGSATPSVETMYRARAGMYTLCCLTDRFNGMDLPQVQLVDMKEEIRAGNDSVLSRPLLQAMEETMARGEQTILFLNRRGASRMLQCVSCGQVPECPRCSVHLTYHSANRRLMCHYCGFSQPVPDRCPQCGGPLKQVGAGTQKVQAELEAYFPGIQVARMDADTVNAVNTHEKILERFQRENLPVLLGTQMVAKGLNLERVTLVGVLDGDLSLYVDSYRAAETTFNVLTQVVGRAGRGQRPGRALIQTMTPEHRVILLASRQDYDGFYDLEVGLREAKGCPPFRDLYTITFSGPDEGQVLRGAALFRDSLLSCLETAPYRGLSCHVLGPAPAAVAKINYHFRYRLTLRTPKSREVHRLLAYLLRQFARDRANRGVSAFAEINGYN